VLDRRGASALPKRHVDGPNSDVANALLASDPSLLAVTCDTAAAVPFVTFDVRRAQAARALGFTVLPG
jgi:hypothetical protein